MSRFALLLAGLTACTPAPLVEATSTSTSTSEATTSSSTTAEPTTGGEPDAPLLSRAIAALAVIDLDSDGHLDLVVDGRGSAIELLRGRGDGSFEPPLALGPPLAELPLQIAGGDLDGDGQRDLVLLLPDSAALLRDGLSVTHEPLALAPPAYHVVLADTDRDGRDDLFFAGDGLLLPFRSDAGGRAPLPPLALGALPRGIILADLDADGALDLVAANYYSHDLSLLRGDGLGGFHPQVLLPVGHHPSALAALDLDQDGALDLVVLDHYGAHSLRGRGDASFHPPLTVGLPSIEWYGWRRLAVCERDGDPQPELVIAHRHLTQAALFELHVDADGHLGDAAFIRTGEVQHLACADLDGDARDDLVFTVREDGQDHLHLLLSSRSP